MVVKASGPDWRDLAGEVEYCAIIEVARESAFGILAATKNVNGLCSLQIPLTNKFTMLEFHSAIPICTSSVVCTDETWPSCRSQTPCHNHSHKESLGQMPHCDRDHCGSCQNERREPQPLLEGPAWVKRVYPIPCIYVHWTNIGCKVSGLQTILFLLMSIFPTTDRTKIIF